MSTNTGTQPHPHTYIYMHLGIEPRIFGHVLLGDDELENGVRGYRWEGVRCMCVGVYVGE